MLKKLINWVLYNLRFDIISSNWEPAHIADLDNRNRFIRRVLERTWMPTNAVDSSGNNAGRGLTDETLAHDLPFLLAEKSGITSLDLSNNQLGEATLEKISETILFNKFHSLNFSNNHLDEAAKSHLPHLLQREKLVTLQLKNCNLVEMDIDALIDVLRDNKTLKNLDISENTGTEAQIIEVNRILRRNTDYHHFKNSFQNKNILDLERCTLDKERIENLSFYIEKQKPFFFQKATLKEIKMPSLVADLKDEDFEPLIQALKANNRITSLTMNYTGVSASVEQQIRTQLMLNQARKKLLDKPGGLLSTLLNHYLFQAAIAAQLLTAFIPALPAMYVLIGAMALRFVSQSYFNRKLNNAKTLDFEQPQNKAAIELGKNAAHSWLTYLNPKAYTPLAYLGYTIEREKLSTKYDVQSECFKPLAPKAKI